MSRACERFESALPDWLEGEPATGEHEAAELAAHERSCASCGALARDLRAIVARAGVLAPLEPERDLWEGIERRIAAPVHSLADVRERPARSGSRRSAPPVRWWAAAAAAAALVITASSAYVAGVRSGNGGAPDPGVVATESRVPAEGGAAARSVIAVHDTAEIGAAPGGPPRSAEAAEAAGRSPAAVASGPEVAAERGEIRRRIELARSMREPMEAEFDREIRSLREIVDERRTQLDSSTVAVIERSLSVIDRAIAESREALAADPASGFLNEQLNYALTRKVELLQTAALLPPRT